MSNLAHRTIETALSGLSIAELASLRDGGKLAAAMWLSIFNRPACQSAKICELVTKQENAAHLLADAATAELHVRAPKDEIEAEIWAEALIPHFIELHDWTEVAAIASAAATMCNATEAAPLSDAA